jgi:hypothetical protein
MQWNRMIPAYGTMRAARPSGRAPRNTGAQGMMQAVESLVYPSACIWEADSQGGVGHASVFIQRPDGGFPETDTTSYASLFPGADTRTGLDGARLEHLGPGRMLAAKFQTFLEDCAEEHDGEGGFRLPDHIIPLRNLDQLRMQAVWNSIRDGKENPHYRLLRKNCSTIAARIIRAGMTRSQIMSDPLMAHKAWWTPYDILSLARACAKQDYTRRVGELVKALG